MKNLTKKITAVSLLFPSLSLAAITSKQDIGVVLGKFVTWAMGIFYVFAVLFLLYSAFLYLGAAGDPERLTQAKDQLIYSIIAIVIALLATSAKPLIESFLK